MEDLDPSERRVIALARAARTPGEADKRRVRAAIALGLTAAAGTAGGAAVAKGATTALIGLRGIAAIVLVASAGTGAYVWLRAAPQAPVVAPVVDVVPQAPPLAPVVEPLAADDPLLAELSLLQRAQRALRGGQPRVALELADRHATLYPTSQMALERGALRVFAFCALGRKAEARADAIRLLAAAPRSPVRTSLEQSCAMK
jgi:hypothetical protein